MPALEDQPSRHFELVTCVTGDSVKLHGLFQDAGQTGGLYEQLPVQAAVVLHGLAGNFYSSTLNLRLADALVRRGISVVLGNTRGHDGISMSPVAGRASTIGAAYEIVDDCRHDVTGWIDWLVRRKRARRILLVGHSLGAIKALYAQVHQPHDNLCGSIGLSATRLNFEQFNASPAADEFKKWFHKATDLVREGNGNQLMQVSFPFPTYMTAEAYSDKYGPGNRYDWLRFVDQIHTPTLLLFGERELSDNPAFHGLMENVRIIGQRYPQIESHVVPSANHFYAGVHHRATEVMDEWLIRTFGQEADSASETA